MTNNKKLNLLLALALFGNAAHAQRPAQPPAVAPLKAVAVTKQRADAGHIPSQITLASKLVANRHFADALVWYRQAAALGSSEAAYNVGNMLLFGMKAPVADQVVIPDPAEGVRWTFRAATNRHAGACRNMNIALQRGLGVKTNITEAYAWLQLYAESEPQRGGPELDDLALRLDLTVLTNARKLAAQFKSRRWPELSVVTAPKFFLPLRLEGVTLAGENSLAVVNRRTLAAGETTQLPLVRDLIDVKCLEIRAESVLVEVEGEGQPRWLLFATLPAHPGPRQK